MTGYGVTLAKYDPLSDSYRSASFNEATHAAEYGDGALIHAIPISTGDTKQIENLIKTRFRYAKELRLPFSTKISKESLEGRTITPVPRGNLVHEITEMINRAA